MHCSYALATSRPWRPIAAAACLLLASAAAPGSDARAQCSNPDPSIGAARWCISDIPFYWGPGLETNTPATLPWRSAINAAVTEINALGALDLATPLFLFNNGSVGPNDPTPATGIVFQLVEATAPSCSGADEADIGLTIAGLGSSNPGSLDTINGALVVFASGARGAGYDLLTIVRHELCHALGVGHSGGTGCLMNPSLSCGQTRTLDASAEQALICLYGDAFGGDCAPNYGILIESSSGDSYTFRIGACNCGGGGCGAPKQPQPALSPAALTYEFAISESGGPYTVFATPLESDLTNGRFAYTFTQSYTSGLVRLQVLNGASVVDTAYLNYPISVQVATAAPGASVPQTALAVENAPNPFAGETALTFTLPGTENVAVVVYDAAGRRVATLQDGPLGPGSHRLLWGGRGDDGAPLASGIYRALVTAGGRTSSKTVVKLR